MGWKKTNKLSMCFNLPYLKEMGTCTLERPVTLFEIKKLSAVQDSHVGKYMKVLLCDTYFSASEAYFRLNSWCFLLHLYMTPFQLPIMRNALERNGSSLTPELVSLGWQCSVLEPGKLYPSLSPESRRKCPNTTEQVGSSEAFLFLSLILSDLISDSDLPW